jgi:hypothetical protein
MELAMADGDRTRADKKRGSTRDMGHGDWPLPRPRPTPLAY